MIAERGAREVSETLVNMGVCGIFAGLESGSQPDPTPDHRDLYQRTAMADENPSTNPSEIWKPVVGYEGFYEVSSDGQVRRLTRQIRHSKGGWRTWPGRIIRQTRSATRYCYFTACVEDGRGTLLTHVVVCTAFHGPRPSPRHVVAHWDGNSDNNHASNLRWATPEENEEDKRRHGRLLYGAKNHQSKLTADRVLEMRRLYASGEFSFQDIGVQFGVDFTTVYKIIRGLSWRHVPNAFPDAKSSDAVRLRGVKAAAKAITPERRLQIGQMAANRWKKVRAQARVKS